ncbi:MAG: STAS domain-containing protein [Spirochaetes bacterium]|nr:STAS domain-containing protein [Spirochaetota bacterium]
MEIYSREYKSHIILVPNGDIDYFSVGELKNAVFKLIQGKIRSIIIDLKKVEYIDSSGFGLIVAACRAMNDYNGKLGLMNVRDDIMALLKLATFNTIMDIYKSERELK